MKTRAVSGTLLLVAGPIAASAAPPISTQALDPEVMALHTSADLVAKDVGLSSKGEAVFVLQNRGDVGINVPVRGVPNKAPAPGAAPKIKVDVYVDNVLKASVYQDSLVGKGTHPFLVPLQPNVPKCNEQRTLKVVVDPQRVIPELHDDNNATTQPSWRPCPDLAVKSIVRDAEGVAGEMYRAKVTIVNKGNAESPATKVWATALTSAPGINGWPDLSPNEPIPALAPGATVSFKTGGSNFSTAHCWVRVILDRFSEIEEQDEGNNFIDKTL